MSQIQALLLNKDYYTKRDITNFLRRNNIQPIKAIHVTNKYYRCRLITPNYKKYYYRIGTLKQGLDCIYQFLK